MVRKSDVAKALARLRGGRTRKFVAENGGIKPPAWSLYERGRRMPDDGSLTKIARGLGVSRKDLEREILLEAARRVGITLSGSPPTEGAVPVSGEGEVLPHQGVLRHHLQSIAHHVEGVLVFCLGGGDGEPVAEGLETRVSKEAS